MSDKTNLSVNNEDNEDILDNKYNDVVLEFTSFENEQFRRVFKSSYIPYISFLKNIIDTLGNSDDVIIIDFNNNKFHEHSIDLYIYIFENIVNQYDTIDYETFNEYPFLIISSFSTT